jgi:hypothetical protein
MNPGLLYAALAFGIWGLYPLYLLQIASVPAAGGGAAPLGLVAGVPGRRAGCA